MSTKWGVGGGLEGGAAAESAASGCVASPRSGTPAASTARVDVTGLMLRTVLLLVGVRQDM
eukprot:319193-Prorocentrum_minimum.AAC.1